MPFQSADIFYPSDLAIMQTVFDRHCVDVGIPPNSPAAEDIADAVVTLFKMGLTDEHDLAEAVAGRGMKRKAG